MTGAKDSFKLMDIFRPVNLLGVVRCLHDLNPETVFDGPKLFKLLYSLQPPLGKGGKAVSPCAISLMPWALGLLVIENWFSGRSFSFFNRQSSIITPTQWYSAVWS